MLNKWHGWVMLNLGHDRPHVPHMPLQKISSSLKATRNQLYEVNARLRAINEKIKSKKTDLRSLNQEILNTANSFNRLRELNKFNLSAKKLSGKDCETIGPEVTFH
ncbi:MAG: hypothetical protein HQL69_17790 [Magnetococcales bacterium]|nr:hypothetical protein [Magnetococcales bacterium]